jgi:hypothetical protein
VRNKGVKEQGTGDKKNKEIKEQRNKGNSAFFNSLPIHGQVWEQGN